MTDKDQLNLPFEPDTVQPVPEMHLEIKLSAKFITTTQPTPQEQVSLDALNMHTIEVAQRLMPAVKALIVEMLTMKQEFYGGADAGFNNPEIPPDD